MSIKVYIHRTHRRFTDGLDIVEVEGNNVGNCLDDLIRHFPGMANALFDKKGKLLNAVEIYINQNIHRLRKSFTIYKIIFLCNQRVNSV